MKDKGYCIWIFGKVKTGKTTIAYHLLQKKLRNYINIDGDRFRRSITPHLDFTRKDIIQNNRECLKLVDYLTDEGWDCIVSMITPFAVMRKEIKAKLKRNVLLVMLECPESIREKRKNFFKSTIRFEKLGSYGLKYDTSDKVEVIRDKILKVMKKRGWI